MQEKKKQLERNAESGAALVTVVLVSFLLLTACVAMLTAVGANSRNTTDVLSETKAYYAAESGLQATINVLRGNTDTTPGDFSDDIDYVKAVTLATSNYSGDPTSYARLSRWISYNYPTTGTPNRVVIGEAPGTYSPNSGAAFSIEVDDPDPNEVSVTFSSPITILAHPGGTLSATTSGLSRTIYIPNATASARTEIVITGNAGVTYPFTGSPANPNLASIQMTNVGGGATFTVPVDFNIDYVMSSPRQVSTAIRARIAPATAGSSTTISFGSPTYQLVGSTICLAASDSALCSPFTLSLAPDASAVSVFAKMTPPHPYRLKITATGYGPNGATKKLEAIVRRSLLDGIAAGAATSMIGAACPAGQTCFAPGTSNGITYNGCSALGCVPSFGLTDPTNLAYVLAHPPSGNPAQMQPPPAMLGSSIPSWQTSPAALDILVDQIRTSAQNSGRYFLQPGGNLMNPGNFAAGTGITFCEGSCQVGGDGGGILVVTGRLTNLGGFNFRGMIIVTGQEGWLRNGGGNGQVIGNVVIAPYNRMSYVPENLSSTFLPPIYQITGGGGSDVIYGDVTASFDNTAGISDLMAGVAEK